MPDTLTIDETIDTALALLERGASCEVEGLASWVVDNVICELDEYRQGACSTCEVAGHNVLRVGEHIVVTSSVEAMNSTQARMLAAALLRAAEAADIMDG